MFRPAHAAYCVALMLMLSLAGCGGSAPPPAVAPPETSENLPPQNAPPPPVEQAPLPQLVPVTPPPAYLNGKTDVALLLPLTGPNAGLGADMLDAAQMAVVELGGSNLALTPKDTGGTPDGAAKAAQEAVAEGAKIILGPLTAAEVQAVKPVTQNTGINVLAFSNVAQVAGNGVYLLGFMPEQEVRRVVGYAHATGVARFAVFGAADAYGQLAANTLRDQAASDGATLASSVFYQPNESDLAAQSQQLAASGQDSFDALLLPEGGQALNDVATQLSALQIGLPKTRLLGTGLWDGAALAGQPILVGGWYAAPPPDARAGFEQRFTQSFGHAPQRLASLAYDAVGLAAVLDRAHGGDFSAQALTNPSGYAGANGIFRLLADGSNERGLAVLEVEQTGISVVSPAPPSFADGSQSATTP